ncbi:Fic family protein [Chitinophaga niabensis]|uniref:Fic family protein n=1 Tax=Chitinophaga niabensis TaxID=536979 RepID=UPI0031B9DECA
MDNILEDIYRLSGILSKLLPIEKEFQDRLDKKIRLEFNYNSNHMEGNTLTYGETELLLIFDKTTGKHDLREYEEMKAHDAAFELMKDWARDYERPLSEAALRYLHKILLVRPYWKEALTPDGQPTRREIEVGNYKTQPNSVRLQNGEIFHYASPEETPMLMGDLISWYQEEESKKELHPIELAALLHYRFVRIHPFDDGNGRISRLLMNYVLFKHNLPPVVIKSADKKNYLFALNQADAGDIGAFINYIKQQMVWSLELYIKAAKGESLDEDGDLQKEIAIWKKEAASKKVNGLHRNDGLVYEIYHNGAIAEMFAEFEQQHRQFYDMFYSNKFYAYKDNTARLTLEELTEEINRIGQRVAVKKNEVNEFNPEEDNFNSIWVGVYLSEYKYNDKKTFGVTSQLQVNLEPYNYIVSHGSRVFFKKDYNQYLTSEERKFIVTESIKDVFKQIKTDSRK